MRKRSSRIRVGGKRSSRIRVGRKRSSRIRVGWKIPPSPTPNNARGHLAVVPVQVELVTGQHAVLVDVVQGQPDGGLARLAALPSALAADREYAADVQHVVVRSRQQQQRRGQQQQRRGRHGGQRARRPPAVDDSPST